MELAGGTTGEKELRQQREKRIFQLPAKAVTPWILLG